MHIKNKYLFIFSINFVTNMLQLFCVNIKFLQILTIKKSILVGKILQLVWTQLWILHSSQQTLTLYRYFNELEQGLAKHGVRTKLSHPYYLHDWSWSNCKVWGHTLQDCYHSDTTRKFGRFQKPPKPNEFSSSLEGFIELTESYYTYNYDLWQGNDTH